MPHPGEGPSLCILRQHRHRYFWRDTKNSTSPSPHPTRLSKHMLQYPHWTGHRDKRGQPLYYFDMEAVTSKTLAAHTKSSESISLPDLDFPKSSSLESLRSFTAFDYAIRFIMPLCSLVPTRPNPSAPISRAIYIIDIATVSLSQVWGARSWIKSTADLLANTYPEILDLFFVVLRDLHPPAL